MTVLSVLAEKREMGETERGGKRGGGGRRERERERERE